MNNILDVFDNLLEFNENNVIIIFDKNSNMWLKLRDVMNILGYENIDKAITNVDIDDDNKKSYNDINTKTNTKIPLNFSKNTIFISEAGLYQLLATGTTEKSKMIRNDLFGKIIQQIRKTGSYSVNKNTQKKLSKRKSKNKSTHRSKKISKSISKNRSKSRSKNISKNKSKSKSKNKSRVTRKK